MTKPKLTLKDKIKRKNLFSLMSSSSFDLIQEHAKEFMHLMTYYRCAMMEVETKLNVLNEEFSLIHDRNPISSIKSRLKDIPSIMEKLERRGLPHTIEAIENDLYDIAGIRVVCNFVEDVYSIADTLLKHDDITLFQIKDYIEQPKENGYRSLHLIISVPIFLENEKKYVKVEIQLRTIAMDCWATLDHQLRYKKDYVFTEDMSNDLFECAQLASELDAKMNALRETVEAQEGKNE